MNTGRFFELDRESSVLTEGVAVFNYTALKLRRAPAGCPEYPVYMYITETAVTFCMHYCDEAGHVENHVNVPILTLPLVSTGAGNTLHSVLEDIYDVSFQYLSFAPMDGNDDSAGLYGAFRNYYAVSPDHKKASTPSYRTLREFMEKKDDALEQNRCFLRYLFLDFLYDLEHSEVFMNSEYYEVLYSNLHDDFYFHSISCKAEFYYQRQLADMWRRGKDGSAESLDDEMLEHLGDYLIDAETKWVDCLSSSGAEDVLYHGNRTWFTDVEEEMDAIYVSPDRSDTIVGEIENKALVQPLSVRMWHTAKKASDWYIDRYNFMGTLKIWHSGNYVFWAALIIAAVVGIITLFLIPMPLISLLWGLGFLGCAAVFWLMPSICSWVIPGLRGHLLTVGRVNYLMPRLFASIVTAWFTLALGQDIFIGFFDNLWHNKTSLATSGVLLSIMAVFVYYEISRQNPNGKTCGKIGRSLSLLLVAFLYSFVSGLFIIHFFGQKYIERNDYLEEFYAANVFVEKDTLSRKFPIYSFDPSYEAMNEMYEEAIQYEDKKGNIRAALEDTLNVYSFEEILQDKKIMDGLNAKAILVKSLPYLKHQKREEVSGKMTYSMEKKKGVILDITKIELWVFRNLLLQFSFFALFIGIFLQLIFDERTVTHPL